MPLPITNARLLKITAAGPGGGYRDDPPNTGAKKWEGNVGAFVEEKVMKKVGAEQVDRVKQTSIVIPGDLRPPIDIETDDLVFYRYRGKEYTRPVQMHEGWFGVGPKIVELFFTDD